MMSENTSTVNVTPKHVRAARALLAWSQQDLAKAAGVATSTLADFERGHRTPVANNAQAIRAALEAANIRFLPTGAVVGPPVPRLTPAERPGMPIRWVDAEDLADWANRNDGAFSLSTLLAHLVSASSGPDVQLRFPSDEGVRHPGWDGRTSTEVGSTYVPHGQAGWEIGSQRNNIAQKATDDFRKRTQNPSLLEPADATFVFVTPRHWPQKGEWVKARQDEEVWREVRAYDADDLVHWIEQTPAVGLWLATRLRKRPAGTRELDDFWSEWSLATQWPLTEDLVLSDRDQDATEILRWLRGEPFVLSLQAATTDEVVAFFHATLSTLPEEVATAYRARCLVLTTAESARALANAAAPLIMLLMEAEPGLAQLLAERGHYVLLAYDERNVSRGVVRVLARPTREGIANALTAAGIAEARARSLARDCARNLAVLRRLIPGAPGREPDWARVVPPRALLAAVLAGGWDEQADADRAQLAELADQPYESVLAALAPFVGNHDSPLRKIGSTWRVASPPDAWLLLARYLTGDDIARFEAVAHNVLSATDPRFEMDPDERWKAPIRGVQRPYSGMLRHGVGQTLILLALWGDKAHVVPEAWRRADAVVEKLLDEANPQRWWSLSGDFRLLAEASPKGFMNAVEESLDQEHPPIRSLFGSDEGGIFATEHLSDLLWALESLAWSPELMPRVSILLARLDAIDKPPGRYANRPANSLREIHLLWVPQTFATLDQRMQALDLVRKHESDSAWTLMLGVLPKGHDSSSPSPMPRWRDFTVDKLEVVTYGLIGRGAVAITIRLVKDVGVSVARWLGLIERLSDLAPDAEAAFAALSTAEKTIKDLTDRAEIWKSLRRVLHQHRQFPDAEWSMQADVLDKIEVLYDRFAPLDPLERVAWLFEAQVALPKPSSAGWEAEERDVDLARRTAAQALFSKGGAEAILSLARLASAAGYIGKALHESKLPNPDFDATLQAALRSDNDRERDVAHGMIVSAFGDRGEPWAAALIARAKGEMWGDTALLTILRALPVRRWTWDQVTQAGPEMEKTYWRLAPVLWMSDNDDVVFAIRKLIWVGRARHALSLAGRGGKANLPTELLVEVMQEASRQPSPDQGSATESTMFQHYAAEILQLLDERADLDEGVLIALEWRYLPVLEHSRRPAKVLLKALSEQPSLFVQMLTAVFKATEDSGVIDVEPADPEHARAVADQAYRLLDLWDRLPGINEDGTVDGEKLESWIKEARSLAKDAGRAEIADSRIGQMLSASPMGEDGNWPAEAVRDSIDLFRSKAMIDGFAIGKENRRGVTTRMPRDGGDLERREAALYRGWAKAIQYAHPRTARALDDLADSYERQSRHHDERSERLDWE
jgi:transcriptional regulator with XRE-family HTH domain